MPIDPAELQRLLRDEQAQLVEVLLEAARRFADLEPEQTKNREGRGR